MALRVGMIGCGGIAEAHLNTLKGLEDANLVAFQDIDGAKAARFAELAGQGNVYSDFREMYDKESLDAVWVCVPPFAHEDQELIACEKGIPFFCEKPVALTMGKAREVEAAAEKAGLITGAGYLVRYMDTAAKVKELIEGKQIDMFEGHFSGGFPGVYWWRRMELSGGQFVEQTTHIVDILRYFLGDVERVSAFMAQRDMEDIENINIPTVGTVGLELKSGAVGAVHNTCIVSQGYKVGATLLARDLVVEYTYTRVTWRTPDASGEFTCDFDGMVREDAAFLKAIQTGDASLVKSTYSDAVKTLAVTLAANASAESKQVVSVDSFG